MPSLRCFLFILALCLRSVCAEATDATLGEPSAEGDAVKDALAIEEDSGPEVGLAGDAIQSHYPKPQRKQLTATDGVVDVYVIDEDAISKLDFIF